MSDPDLSKMGSRELLDYFLSKSYEDARSARKNGKLVCWSSSIAPSEFCEVMDVCTVYPENHAAAIGAKKGALDMIGVAENLGYSIDICSYARVNIAYMELLKEEALTGKTPKILEDCPAERVPLPDFILICNNICNTLLKWYENIAIELNVPYIIIDVPYNHTMPVPQYTKDYIRDQFGYAIRQLEEICHKPFDYEKFTKVQEQTQRSVRAWDKAMAMAEVKPSPMKGFDIFNFMALIVCARSKKDSEIVFTRFAEEMQEKIDKGIDAFNGQEHFRLAWEGIACWPYLSHTFKSLKSLGANMVGSTYPGSWSIRYDVGDLDQMATAYATVYGNTCLSNKVKVISDVVKNAKCDGVAYHLNRSCKLMSFLNVEIADLVREETGTSYVNFDGDQTDPRNFAPAQFDTRMQALVETKNEGRRS
ncbi:MAG: 2-hydroxyacyl-CoA dehydratase family protein [Rhodospirillaceae bacterium]|nr:2-hydroxyacyl-CoA dehydratase family protein [Rhodospirillaceae bacterium]